MLILLILPFIWILPTTLMIGELAGALPEVGGFYVWVRRALGLCWGYQEAGLSLAASVFDMAIYPTLFALYLGRLAPGLAVGWQGYAWCHPKRSATESKDLPYLGAGVKVKTGSRSFDCN